VTTWQLIATVALSVFALRSLGLTAGDALRRLTSRVEDLTYLTPAVLAGLVVTASLGGPGGLSLDARVAGIAAAACALMLRAPVLVTVGVAMLATAAVRVMS
jgi:branched-subunit amino acid transport protein